MKCFPALLVGLATTTVFCFSWAAGQAEDQKAGASKPASNEELFVIGPYNLGDLYEKWKDSTSMVTIGAAYAEKDGASDAEIVKSLNDTRVYIIDKRIRRDSLWRFASYTGKDHPKAAGEGKMFHEFKTKKGHFSIEIAELYIMGGSLGTDSTVSPEHR